MHTHNGDPLSLFANLMLVHVHNLQTYDNLVSMHINIYILKEIKVILFSSIFYLYTLSIVQNVILSNTVLDTRCLGFKIWIYGVSILGFTSPL